MRQHWAYRLLIILAALTAGYVAYIAATLLWLASWTGRIQVLDQPLIFGMPVFGGAPLWIHIANHAWWGIPAAFGYTIVLRLGLGGPIRWRRLLFLYVAMVLVGIVIAYGGMARGVSAFTLLNAAHLIWFLTGLFIVRDWVVRPVHKPVRSLAGAAA
ncbi:hypothetical protein JJJ17_05785 [Paracoccus caeni]|uniref:Uncharacterized protein n=1 Tax=Paracoccus caeni TaxID=657651 RepID=A0A934VZL7_9RHOB|nr:hypothetical protein [Paracoccus caeni]MBK4215433.1 hypothetical protein [Paracoccus caeni]